MSRSKDLDLLDIKTLEVRIPPISERSRRVQRFSMPRIPTQVIKGRKEIHGECLMCRDPVNKYFDPLAWWNKSLENRGIYGKNLVGDLV